MKKLLSLLLCIVFVCFALVGCAEDVIGEYLENYNTNLKTDDKVEKLNFYIITGDDTSAEAKITVPQNINAYLKEKYEIELNIVYSTASEYAGILNTAMNKTNEAERPDIILINSKEMFNSFYEGDKLVSLNDFYNHRDFKSINTIVDRTLLTASAVINNKTGVLSYYTVPNNHVIGQYKYVVINKAMARDTLHFSNEEISAMTTEESLGELLDALSAYYNSDACTSELSEEDFIAQNVSIVPGKYEDRQLLEYAVDNASQIVSDATKVNFVNINAYPNATLDEAFASGFAIVKHLDDLDKNSEEKQAALDNHYSKCMKIIYALNTDAQFKNMLQYGYVGTNYSFVKNSKYENTNYITLEKKAEVVYQMNPIYTGNPFISYYCEELGWTESVHSNILKQNGDAKTPAQKVNDELSALNTSIVTSVNEGETVLLPVCGLFDSDVTFIWTSENPEIATVDENGVINFADVSADTNVTLKLTIHCGGITGEDTFRITVKNIPDESVE